MREDYSYFEKEIYRYCDENIGEKVLFSVFTNLWREEEFIIKKDLIGITEKIINDLIKRGILIDMEKPEKLEGFYELESPYGYYEIKPPH
ncbi:MAG: hypothetical protein NTZ83_00530 [Candidatus Pacearchaeota archaeon]|nr:hypothetical protein [Candidatus Pacearchaeota archaeon]